MIASTALRLPKLYFRLIRLHHGLLLLYLRLVRLHFRYVDYFSSCLSDTSDYCVCSFNHFDYYIFDFQLLTNIHIQPSSPSLKPTYLRVLELLVYLPYIWYSTLS
jgi:hypothetical protein